MKKGLLKILKAILTPLLANAFGDDTAEQDPFKKFQILIFKSFQKVISILTDKNPDNKAQLKEMWVDDREELAVIGLDISEQLVLEKYENDPLLKNSYETIFADLKEQVKEKL